jgi:hypothetical protein
VEGIKEKICRIEEENLRLHQILITKSAELWDHLEKLRQLGESVKDQKGTRNLCCVGVTPSNLPPENGNNNGFNSRNDIPIITETKVFESVIDSIPLKNGNCEELNEENEPLILDDLTSSNCSEIRNDGGCINSPGLSTMVRTKQEGWPWLDPTEHTTML